MSFLNKYVFVLVLLLAFSLRADVIKEIENYIQSRINGTPVKETGHCAFRHQLDLKLNLQRLSPQLKKRAVQLLSEPERQQSVVSPSGHFTLHFDISGYHAVPPEDSLGNGIPDYIDSAMVIFDHVWDVEINRLGFQPPPAPDGGARENYHVYFSKSYEYYGWTTPDQQISTSRGTTYTSFLEINANFFKTNFYTGGLDAMRVTAAHEFNHAIQLGYNLRTDEFINYPDLFFLEMTSTWLEDYVYNEVNDYYFYLDSFIPNIDRIKFNATYNNYDYANALYLHMLEKKYGAKIVPEIWGQIVEYEAIPAINSVLARKASSFGRLQNEYAVWLYFTGERSISGSYFPEAAFYPMLLPAGGQDEIEQDLDGLRMRHVQIDLQGNMLYKAKITANNKRGFLNHISDTGLSGAAVKFGQYQSFYQPENTKQCVVVLSNPADESIDGIRYNVNLHGPVAGPNPLKVKKNGQQLTFYNVPDHSTIYVYTLNGRFLAKLHSVTDGRSQVVWEMKDKHGQRLASGIYIYVIRYGGHEIIGKFAVVR